MSSRRPRTFYGWVIVLTAAIGLLLGYAPVFVYSFSVFIKSLAQDFHSSRTSISFAFTLANLMQSVGAPLVGRLVDRFGAHKVIVPSTVIFGLVLISFKYFSTSLWQLYVFFLLIGFIGTGAAPVPYGIVVSRWFDKRRGLALGLMMFGISIGAILMPPVAQRLIALFGWRTAYAIVGFAVLAISVPIVGIFLKDSPEKMGLQPDGAFQYIPDPAFVGTDTFDIKLFDGFGLSTVYTVTISVTPTPPPPPPPPPGSVVSGLTLAQLPLEDAVSAEANVLVIMDDSGSMDWSIMTNEANGVFAKIPRSAIAKLQKRYFFYVWNEQQSVVRWMCSFDTTEQDVKEFARFVAQTVNR